MPVHLPQTYQLQHKAPQMCLLAGVFPVAIHVKGAVPDEVQLCSLVTALQSHKLPVVATVTAGHRAEETPNHCAVNMGDESP